MLRARSIRLGIGMLLYCSLLVLLLGMSLTLLWFWRGGRILSVQTGSMVPTFRVGDAVLVQRVRPEKLRVGDIIAYRTLTNQPVTLSHRIIGLTPDNRRITTKGDHTLVPDSPVRPSQIIGRVQLVAPGYGKLTARIRQPLGLALCVYFPVSLLVAFEVWLFFRAQARPIYRVHSKV